MYSVDFSKVSGQIASGSKDKTIRLWKPTVYAPAYDEHARTRTSFTSGGPQPFFLEARIFCREGKSTTISAHSATVRCVNFASNGRMLLSASDDKTLKVWALPTQRFMFTLSGHMNWVRSAQFSPDCRLAVSGGDDKTMRVWDISTKSLLRLYDDHHSVINTVAFHPDGTCIASAGTDKVIRVWDIRYVSACT